MALINCSECGGVVSSNAEACPRCGNPMKVSEGENLQVRTPARQTEISTKAGVAGTGAIIGLVGLVLVFLVPPVGVVMLIVAGAMSSMNKKIPGLLGSCPYCHKLINMPREVTEVDCPLCHKKIINEVTHFAQVGAPSLDSDADIRADSSGDDDQVMTHYQITYNDGQYCCGGYRYSNLNDAVAYAKLLKRRQGDT